MSSNPYAQAVAATREVLANVAADQLGAPTPCASYNVGQLIDHLVGAQYFFLAGLEGTPPVGADAEYHSGDYLAAYDDITAKAIAAFSEPGVMEKMLTLPFGEMPGAAVMGLATNDTLTHGWDLAKATGQDTDLAPELAAAVLEQARATIPDEFRGPEGAPFGPEQPCADDAPAADRLAAFLGRTV
jgi:uncharacterized protein (TIGR03086 family)